MLALAALLVLASPPKPGILAGWGAEILERARKELLLPESGLYAQYADARGHGPASDAWPAGEMLQALAAAAVYDPKYKPWLAEYAAALRRYWDASPPTPGFGVRPLESSPDRYYDDNAWLTIGLAQAAGELGSPDLGRMAMDGLTFCLSGVDPAGGVYWHEQSKTTQNMCSTAPTIVALLTLRHDAEAIATATRLYDWTWAKLHDPASHLFFDHVEVPSGKVEKTLWSYNSGMAIEAGSLLFAATDQVKYAEQARLVDDAAAAKWVRDDGAITDGAPFAQRLVEGWIVRMNLAKRPGEAFGSVALAASALVYLHDHGRDRDGHYPSRWDAPRAAKLDRWKLIDQAAAACAYFEVASFLRSAKR